MQDDVVVGDEIITAGGMHAVVKEAGESELRIEIAPGVIVTLDRRAVAAVAVIEGADEGEDVQVPNEAAEIPNHMDDPPTS
jgi:preprotein translocase subunit YajC